MSSKHRVDPQLLPLLSMAAAGGETLQEQRAMADQMRVMAQTVPIPDAVEVREQDIPGPAGAPTVSVVVITPKAPVPARPAILHMHGGGYVIGSAQLYQPQLARLSAELGAVIVSVNYRLAPETVFPGAIDDCYAALSWLSAEADALRVDRARIVVSGESAGGGLAASLAILARDRNEIPLCGQILTFPMIDDRTGSGRAVGPFQGEFIWTAAANRMGWEALLGHAPGADGVSPHAAASRCEDLAGLPPAFIAVGDLDLFLEENLDYARRLARAGAQIEVRVYPGAIHGFMLMEDAGLSKLYAQDRRVALERFFSVTI